MKYLLVVFSSIILFLSSSTTAFVRRSQVPISRWKNDFHKDAFPSIAFLSLSSPSYGSHLKDRYSNFAFKDHMNTDRNLGFSIVNGDRYPNSYLNTSPFPIGLKSGRQFRSRQLMKRNFIAPLIATTCALSVFLYVFFNIEEIREKQKIATENAIKEQNETISSAQAEQKKKIEQIKREQQEAIDKIKNQQNKRK